MSGSCSENFIFTRAIVYLTDASFEIQLIVGDESLIAGGAHTSMGEETREIENERERAVSISITSQTRLLAEYFRAASPTGRVCNRIKRRYFIVERNRRAGVFSWRPGRIIARCSSTQLALVRLGVRVVCSLKFRWSARARVYFYALTRTRLHESYLPSVWWMFQNARYGLFFSFIVLRINNLLSRR